MTEAKWQLIQSPSTLLQALRRLLPKLSTRKARLYTCACCRWVPNFASAPELVEAVTTVEAFADGLITMDQLNAFRNSLYQETRHSDTRGAWPVLRECVVVGNARVWDTARQVASLVATLRVRASLPGPYRPDLAEEMTVREAAERLPLCQFVRDIFGNPFRPVAFEAAWRTSAVVALAGQMYESRDFAEMPILADALEDAGCDNADVIAHCRDPQATHVRGCWVVDLVLGKS